MVELMTQMSRQLSALNIQQATTKKPNAFLLVSARKSKVNETVTYDIQQAVADVVAAIDNFCDNRVCVLCQLYFNSLDLTP